jgi:putative membrane protein
MKLHPLSVPYRVVSRGVSVAVALFFVGSSFAGTGVVDSPLLPIALAVVGVAAAVAWEVAYYRRFAYELTTDTLDVHSGVVSRRDREIPLRRIQNVDISRNVVQRALGIAAVEFETAGGGDTEATLRFVAAPEAKRLQRELARLKEGADAATRDEDGDALFEIADEDLAVLSVASIDPRVVSLVAFFLPFAATRAPDSVVEGAFVLLTALAAVAGVVTVWVASAAVTFARYYGFRLSRVGDELRYERGLLQRYDGSIPLDKVQSVTVRENLVMRALGYASLAVETAGYAPGSSPSGGSEAAVPLARHDYVLDLAASLEGDADPGLTRPPKRARRRYAMRYLLALGALVAVLYAVSTFLFPFDYWYAPAALVPVAPVAAHLKWASRGYHLGENHFVARAGFWRRETHVVPYYRVQTVIESATAFQRRWQLASVIADTAGSLSLLQRDASALDVDAEVAERLRTEVHERMQAARLERRTRQA